MTGDVCSRPLWAKGGGSCVVDIARRRCRNMRLRAWVVRRTFGIFFFYHLGSIGAGSSGKGSRSGGIVSWPWRRGASKPTCKVSSASATIMCGLRHGSRARGLCGTTGRARLCGPITIQPESLGAQTVRQRRKGRTLGRPLPCVTMRAGGATRVLAPASPTDWLGDESPGKGEGACGPRKGRERACRERKRWSSKESVKEGNR